MHTSDWVSVLSAFAVRAPVLLACIAGLAIVLNKPALAPDARKWAAAGFGLELVLCFAAPATQLLLLSAIRSGDTSRGVLVSGASSLLVSLLHAAAFVMLLAAVLAGQRSSDAEEVPTPKRNMLDNAQ